MNQNTFNELWQKVDDALAENTPSGYKMAIIEADKVLNFFLKKKGYPGEDTKERLFLAKSEISNLEELKKAIKTKGLLLNEFEVNLNSLDCEEIVSAYKEAAEELSKSITGKSWLLIFAPFLRWKKRGGHGKRFFKYFLLILISIWFLFGTEIGQTVGEGVVAFFSFLFNWFLIILSLAAGVFLVVVLSFIYFEKRK